jgi:flagellar M-ring protein FliF
VTLIDYRGKVLSQPESEHSLTGQQLDMRQKMESEMAAKIVQILEPAVGAGRVRPQVSIAMNFQQVDEQVEQYDPNGSVIKSQERLNKSAPGNRITGGVVAPRPVPPANATPETAPPAAPQSSTESTETINYEVSKSVRHIVNPVGTVEKLSVAVLIDNKTEATPPPAEGGEPGVKSVARKPEEMTQFENLVKSAIGFNQERGDLLTVTNISFSNESEVVGDPGFLEKQAPNILTGLRYVIIPVVFILIYLLFVRPVQRTVLSTWEPVAAGHRRALHAGGAQTPMTVKQLEARLQNGDLDALADTPERELLPLPQQSRMDLIRKRVVEQTKQDPETVARLVRVWLNEEKNK